MKKKWITLLSVMLTLALFVTACGGGGSSAPPANSGGSSSGGSSSSGGGEAKSEKKYDQGVTDTEIVVGNWAPQTGPAANYSLIAKGVDAYFKYVNEQGGVNGRKIKFITYDDEYQPSKTVAVAKKLVEEDKVFALVGNVCTSCNKAAMPYLKKVGIPVVGVSSGAGLFVDPPTKNYFGLITNYKIEAKIFVKYALDTLKVKKAAIFFQNDDFGKEGQSATVEELKKAGVEVIEIPYNTTDVDFSAAAIKIKEAKPDVIFGFTVPKPGAAFVKELDKLGVNNIPFLSTYVTGGDTVMFDLAGKAWEGKISTNFVPMVDSGDPKVKTFLEQFKKYYPNDNPSGFAQWGWAEAEVFVEAVKRAGDNLTWENLIKSLESLDKWNDGMAYNVTYTPTNRYGQTSVFLIQAKNGKMEKISDIITYDTK